MPQQIPSEAHIREAAYQIWLNEGQPNGCDEDHWLKAIDALTKPVSKRKPKVAAKSKAVKAAPKRATKPKAKAKANAK